MQQVKTGKSAQANMRTLAGGIAVVIGVCIVGLLSVTGAPTVKPRVSDVARAALEATPALALEAGGLERPETYLADISSYGWRDKDRHLLDIKVEGAKLVQSVDARTGEARGDGGKTPLTDRLLGQRVLAVVDPAAANDVKTPGKSYVQMVVVPDRETMQLSISRIVPVTQRARIGFVAQVADAGGPNVSTLSTYAASPGTQIRVTGTGFGAGDGDSWVTVCGVRTAALAWSDTSVTFVVPTGLARAGYVGVVARGVGSNGVYFIPFDPPALDRITPRTGGVGTAVVFEGRHFGSTQGDGWVSFGGASAQVVSWSDTRVVARVPRDTVSGFAGVVRHGMSSNGKLFSPYGYPSVTSLSSKKSLAGGTITIKGSSFGPAPGEAIFRGKAQQVVSWSNTEVTFKVPDAAAVGYVGIRRVGGLTSNGVFLVVGPKLTALSQTWAPPGGEVEIRGVGFGTAQGEQRVTVNRVAAEVVSWSPTAVRVKVPPSASTGYIGVGVPPGTSNGMHLVVTTKARVSAVDTTNVTPDATIVVDGSDFGPTASGATVRIGYSTVCPVVSWSDTRITARVPDSARSGYLGVFKQGVPSNGIWVNVREGER